MNSAIYMFINLENKQNHSKTLQDIKSIAKKKKLKIKAQYFDIEIRNATERLRLNDLLKAIEIEQIHFLLVPNIHNLISKYDMIPSILLRTFRITLKKLLLIHCYFFLFIPSKNNSTHISRILLEMKIIK